MLSNLNIIRNAGLSTFGFFQKCKFRQKFMVAGCCIALLTGISENAQSAPITIDFDGLADGVAVTNQFSGVTFSNTTNVNASSFATSSPNIIISTSGSYFPLQADAIFAVFTTGATTVSVNGIDVGARGVRIDAYDAAVGGSLLDFDSFTGVGVGSGSNPLLSVSGAGILRVELYGLNPDPDDGIGFDDFTFDTTAAVAAASEPPTLALLGLGFAGLGAMRRRRAA